MRKYFVPRKNQHKKDGRRIKTTTEEKKSRMIDSGIQTYGRKQETMSSTETDACACVAWQNLREQK